MKSKEVTYGQWVSHKAHLESLDKFRFHSVKQLGFTWYEVVFTGGSTTVTIKSGLKQKKAEKLAAQLNEVKDAIR